MSLITHRPVLDEFLTLFPATLELSICAILFAILIGLPAGVMAAVKRGSMVDHAVMADVPGRLFHADLLVGPAADHHLLGLSGLDAGFRPHRRSSTSSSR